jgi:acetylornithine deacetylase/succinyl-diaminopimelate desuccinylase-like protein
MGGSILREACLAVWVVACASCAMAPHADPESPASAKRWHDGVDWARAETEAVDVLRGYLRVDTSNPPGNETRGAEYFGDVLQREGIPYEIVESGPGRGSLIARLDGAGREAPLCLVSHIDVVPADAKEWPSGKGPFSGAIDAQGFLWGRGALDMKGLGALELMTMVLLKRAHVPLRRSIVLLAVAGEETDSNGMELVVERYWDKVGCSHSINEGGIGIVDLLAPGQTVYTISVAEKGTLWLKMTAHGEPGHGSTPVPGRAPERLLRAIHRLAVHERELEPRIHPSLYELATRAGDDLGGLTGFVLSRPALVRAFVLPKLLDQPPARATLFNTVNVTGFEGRNEPNVVPSAVSAILDCRVLPGTRPIDLYVEIRDAVNDPDVSFEILGLHEGNESPWEDDPLFHALARNVVAGQLHAVAAPILSPGFTDSLFLRTKGVHAYGFVPFAVTQDELKGYHGRNERVSVQNVHRGLRALFRAVVDVSVQ